MLYRWNNRKFENKYLKKLERNWKKWKSVSSEKKPQRRNNIRVEDSKLELFSFYFLFSFLFLFSYFLELRLRLV